MNRLRYALVLCGLVTGVVYANPPAAQRVVSLGGSVTEIIYDLDLGQRLVADDGSSLYPKAATLLPSVGYYRSVSLEGVVAQRPDLVLASENAGPPKTMQRLKDLGVTVNTVSDQPSLDSLYQRIQQIAQALQVPQAGQQLTDRVRAELTAAQAMASPVRRALVLVNRTGPLLGAGGNTAAAQLLNLAGLENVLSAQTGYKPVSAEGLAMLAPELIIITKASAQASGGMDAFMASAGISSTPAAQAGRVVAMDDLLILGLGPRVAQSVQQLKTAAK